MDSWRTWQLLLPRLERSRDVIAPTLPGHAGGPALRGPVSETLMVEAVERILDQAGLEAVDVAGNSLGGFVALQLAARGRARSVVALAPAGGWSGGAADAAALFALQRDLHRAARGTAAAADQIVATTEGRKRAMAMLVENYEHLQPELIAEQLLAVARCTAAPALLDYAQSGSWALDPAAIGCPVRIVWGTADKLLPWPQGAERFRRDLPAADWVVLDGVGHAPQLDVPLETSELILGFP